MYPHPYTQSTPFPCFLLISWPLPPWLRAHCIICQCCEIESAMLSLSKTASAIAVAREKLTNYFGINETLYGKDCPKPKSYMSAVAKLSRSGRAECFLICPTTSCTFAPLALHLPTCVTRSPTSTPCKQAYAQERPLT